MIDPPALDALARVRTAETRDRARPSAPDAKSGGADPRLELGARVQVRVNAVLNSGDLEVRLRAAQAEQPRSWSQALRVGIADGLRPALLDALRALAAGQARPGAVLDAEVVSLTPRIMLRMIGAEQTEQPGSDAWFARQWRANLPGARELSTTLAGWSRGLAQAGSEPTPASGVQQPELQRAVKQVLERLASPRELTDPARLAQTIRNSGIWLEALLARASLAPQQSVALESDLKAQLLRLAEQIRHHQQAGAKPPAQSAPARVTPAPGTAQQAPAAPRPQSPAPDVPAHHARQLALGAGAGTLAREVDGMLKQLVTLQLHNTEQAPEQLRWALELPFHSSAGLLTLDADIQREPSAHDEDEAHWSLHIALDLPVLGPLSIRLGLRGEHLHASLVAEQSAGAALLRERLSELRAQLEKRAISVGSLTAREGTLERRAPVPRGSLLSEQA